MSGNIGLIRLALRSELLDELLEYTPTGFIWHKSANGDRLVLYSDKQYEYRGTRVYGHVLHLYILNTCLSITHAYFLPDDWPFRSEQCLSMGCRKSYEEPTWFNSIINHIQDLSADPMLRDRKWNPRYISDRKREKKRIQIISDCRHYGICVSDNATLLELKQLIYNEKEAPKWGPQYHNLASLLSQKTQLSSHSSYNLLKEQTP